MAINITMPALSPTMEEGTLAKWNVKPGDTVEAGDVIAEIETDKATMEVEAVDEGTVAQILVDEGTEGVKVNAIIAVLAEEGEDASAEGTEGGDHRLESRQVALLEPADHGVEEVGDDARHGEGDDHRLEKAEDLAEEPDEGDEEHADHADRDGGCRAPQGAGLEGGGVTLHGSSKWEVPGSERNGAGTMGF